MCGSTLFHVLQKQNISLYAFVSSNAVLVKKKGRGIFAILRPFPVGRYFEIYTALSQIPLGLLFVYFITEREKNHPLGNRVALPARAARKDRDKRSRFPIWKLPVPIRPAIRPTAFAKDIVPVCIA